MILKQKMYEGKDTGVLPGWHNNFPGAIFTGKVVNKYKVKMDGSGVFKVRVIFEVERYWKGITDREVEIYTSVVSNGSCGIPFRKGQRYIVFAQMIKNRLVTTSCSFTAESRYADIIIKGLKLGEGDKIVTPSISSKAQPNNSFNRSANSAAFMRET